MATADLTLPLKVCCSCKSELPFDAFYKDKRTKDGVYPRCKKCHCAATKRYYEGDKQKANERAKAWRQANKEKVKEASFKSRLKKLAIDPDFEKRRAREYREEKPDVVKAIEAKKRAKRKETRGLEIQRQAAEYYQQNSEKLRARSRERYYARKEMDRPLVAQRVMARNARKRNATPSWGNKDAIQVFYDRAAELTRLTGVAHHVDHIVPLQSRHVCGLHVEFNLAVKPWVENVSKSNRWWPDCPDHVIEVLPEKVRRELESGR